MDNILETADVLQQALQNQYNADVAANEANRRLADQQVAYANQRTGTLYSGMPTWQRAQNAVQSAEKLAKINDSYASSRIKMWNSVQNTLDQINAYNDAAKQIGGASANIVVPGMNQSLPSTAPIYLNGKWYTYTNGQLKEVQNG